ncbi:MAG: choice-of-anchor D domain-containing protein, partial [Verrucomicrobiota bacterium]
AGDVDPDFNLHPDFANGSSYISDSNLFSMSLQPDAKILCGGDYGYGGGGRHSLDRKNADGTLDVGFSASVGSTGDGVYTSAVLPNGNSLIGGTFGSVNGGGPYFSLARLNAAGEPDPGFNPVIYAPPVMGQFPPGGVSSIAVQTDGKILIGGYFIQVNGVTHQFIARLNADGTLDDTFTPTLDYTVYSIELQTDGKIVVAGLFSTVNGVNCQGLTRLNPDGTRDAGFDPLLDNTVETSAVQADGKILIAGSFSTVNGVPRQGIARLNADGTLDTGFNPGTVEVASVAEIALQANGEMLIAGRFAAVGAVSRNGLARLHVDGSLDVAFNPNPSSWLNYPVDIRELVLQADGKILIGGIFNAVGGVPRLNAARLENSPATQSLNVASANRIEWLRGGSSPETHQVSFEVSIDGGTHYAPLASATRIVGGWECTAANLPASGQIRARARTRSGGLVESVVPFGGLSVPAIAVSANNMNIASGSSSPNMVDHTDFSSRLVDSGTLTRTFTIHNSGTADLILGPITLGGSAASDFSILSAPASPVAAGGSTSFQVTFAPSASGLRSATLSWATNDFYNSPFNFSIQGTGVSSTGDDDGDGVANLLEFAFGTHSADPNSGPGSLRYSGTFGGGGTITATGQPITRIENGSDCRVLFVRRTDYLTAGLTYTPQFSGDLTTWQDSSTEPTVLADDGTQQVVAVSYPAGSIADKPARFARIGVTSTP